MIRPGPGMYEHYKGGRYYVLGIAKNTETNEETVIYFNVDSIPIARDSEEAPLYARPLSNFTAMVSVSPSTERPRFRRVT